jgi:hypothetical protein
VLELKKATIIEEIFSRTGIAGYWADVNGSREKCIAYLGLTAPLKPGDEVILNTTAVTLKLGSGGYHFVLANLSRVDHRVKPGGHIMKMRYSPLQVKVLSAEEPDSPYHEQLKTAETLGKTPVLATTLHSMLAPICLQLNQEKLKVVYIMTDGAALPIAFSETVDWLKREQFLTGTVTIGHAYGGDIEAVNIYSGLLAAKAAFDPDVIITGMGPGIVGTGTKWGFTGIEQGEILNAVEALYGIPIAVPRISFADKRQRHQGISHHTLTVLSKVCRAEAIVPLPVLADNKTAYILKQLQEENLLDKYFCCMEADDTIINKMADCKHRITTMGRGTDEDPDFFLTLGSAAQAVIKIVKGIDLNRIQWA